MKSTNTLEKFNIKNYVSEIKFENLIETPRNFNENHTWINNKYVELVKLKISLDLITENIISFYEKKNKIKISSLNIEGMNKDNISLKLSSWKPLISQFWLPRHLRR